MIDNEICADGGQDESHEQNHRFTDDMGDPALEDVTEQRDYHLRIAENIERLRREVERVVPESEADSVKVRYDEETELGEIRLYYEDYDDN